MPVLDIDLAHRLASGLAVSGQRREKTRKALSESRRLLVATVTVTPAKVTPPTVTVTACTGTQHRRDRLTGRKAHGFPHWLYSRKQLRPGSDARRLSAIHNHSASHTFLFPPSKSSLQRPTLYPLSPLNNPHKYGSRCTWRHFSRSVARLHPNSLRLRSPGETPWLQKTIRMGIPRPPLSRSVPFIHSVQRVSLLTTCTTVRITGGACHVAAEESSDPSTTLITIFSILESVGLSPLLLATVGFLGTVYAHTHTFISPSIILTVETSVPKASLRIQAHIEPFISLEYSPLCR